MDTFMNEIDHFSAAPAAFFAAWKRGVKLAGPALFGQGSLSNTEQAQSKWDLCPNLEVPGKKRSWPPW